MMSSRKAVERPELSGRNDHTSEPATSAPTIFAIGRSMCGVVDDAHPIVLMPIRHHLRADAWCHIPHDLETAW